MNGENSQVNAEQPTPRWGTGLHDRSDAWSPVKTPEGRAEITRRSRALNQRLRTVLLLIDGRRTISQIRTVAVQVGAPDTCLDDLLDMGLVALPTPLQQPAPTVASMPASPPEAVVELTSEAPIVEAVSVVAAPVVEEPPPAAPQVEFVAAAPVAVIEDVPMHPAMDVEFDAVRLDHESDSSKRLAAELFDEILRASPPRDTGPSTMDSTLRTTGGGRLDSMMSSLFPLLESAFGSVGRIPNAERSQDDALEEARRILMREVRSKAPVTGALTLAKLRRAGTREELAALFDEVGSHISLPMRRLSTQQILLHVKGLLDRPM